MKGPRFNNRTRFNWGYHDAANGVRHGWAVPERNFGFGPSFEAATPADVIAKHFDKEYANGWALGFRDAHAGTYANSTAAWNEATAAGTATE
jgi:hypothetical protein